MTDDNADDETSTETTITLAEAIEFASNRAGEEVKSFEGDVPKHAAGLVAKRATNLLGTLTNIKMAQASEQTGDLDDEEITEAFSEDVVDIIMALGALDYEYDLDIAEKFEARVELIEAYDQFEEAVEDAETQEEIVEAVDENMTEELEELMGGGVQPPMAQGPTIGENVDDEDYEHDEKEKSFQ